MSLTIDTSGSISTLLLSSFNRPEKTGEGGRRNVRGRVDKAAGQVGGIRKERRKGLAKKKRLDEITIIFAKTTFKTRDIKFNGYCIKSVNSLIRSSGSLWTPTQFPFTKTFVVFGFAISRISTMSRFSVPHSSKNSRIGPVKRLSVGG